MIIQVWLFQRQNSHNRSLHGNSYLNKICRCDAQTKLIRTQHPLNFVERIPFPIFIVMSQAKDLMKFERTPDIPAIAGDDLAYGMACFQFLDSSLEV
jgi:hypothetical protein